MASRTLVSVEEYLHTEYRPDCDYVDGEIVERNVGELDHSDLQGEIVTYFRSRLRNRGVYAYPEQRIQVSATRFRIPDVCVTSAKPTEQIFRTPPLHSHRNPLQRRSHEPDARANRRLSDLRRPLRLGD